MFLVAYLHQLGVAKSGAHKDHTVIQVGQTLSNGCLSLERETKHVSLGGHIHTRVLTNDYLIISNFWQY